MAEQYFIVYMYHIFCIHFSIYEHVGGFQVLATVNSTAVDVGLHVSFQIRVFSCVCPGVGLQGPTVALFLVF